MNNSTITNTEKFNINDSRVLTQIGIAYGILTIVGLALFLGKWNENNIQKFQIYLLRIINKNIWLYRLLFILSMILYTIFFSALVFVLGATCFICVSICEIIIGLYELCCFPPREQIIPSDENVIV